VPEFQTSPGMRDLLAPESVRNRRLVDVFAGIVEPAGYEFFLPPLLEDVGVFARVGEATEIVSKQMYEFTDLGGRRVALRPELTAGVCRAYVQHRPRLPWKTWSAGPNFRYEKPQRGRYRQFDQLDIEVLGVDDPLLDVEVIALGWRYFDRLGLRRVTLAINSLGEPTDRARYIDALGDHFSANLDALTVESRATLGRNPLRVLDSKREADIEVVRSAPTLADFLSQEASDHFDAVRKGLDTLGIPFTVDPHLVRGLDYYLRTTFEYVGGTLDSAQNGLGGGGRYDGLVEALGGPPTPGVGLAIGVDRTLLACDDEGVFPATAATVEVFVVDTTGGTDALAITEQLRQAGRSADRAFDQRSMKAQMRTADRSGAAVVVIVGPDELAAGTAVVRRLRDGEQTTVARTDLVSHLERLLR
jgi:histidyl-tRNA synthetase